MYTFSCLTSSTTAQQKGVRDDKPKQQFISQGAEKLHTKLQTLHPNAAADKRLLCWYATL